MSGVGIDPIYIDVAQAAEALAVSKQTMYQILNRGAVASRYQGRKRLVQVKSLKAYADGLPEYPEESA